MGVKEENAGLHLKYGPLPPSDHEWRVKLGRCTFKVKARSWDEARKKFRAMGIRKNPEPYLG